MNVVDNVEIQIAAYDFWEVFANANRTCQKRLVQLSISNPTNVRGTVCEEMGL